MADNEQFEDDSSSALDLGHHATRVTGFSWNDAQNAKIQAERKAKGVPDPIQGPGVNAEAYLDLEAKMAEVRKEHPGWPEARVLLEARMILAGAIDLGAVVAKADPLGASPRSLMHKSVDLRGRGGSRSRRKRKPKEKWSCKECRLEFCIHRPVKTKRGRPTKESTVRSVKRSIRMTDTTVQTFLGYRIGPSDALALMGVALRERRSIDAVLHDYLKALDKSKRKC